MNSIINAIRYFFAPATVARYKALGRLPKHVTLEKLHGRTTLIDGVDIDRLAGPEVLLLGAGGLGASIATTLTRFGVPLAIVDFDVIEASNLTRMPYGRHSIGNAKVVELARLIQSATASGATVRAYRRSFEEHVEKGLRPTPRAIVAAVDSDATRLCAAQEALHLGVPLVSVGLDVTAVSGYVFVQPANNKDASCLRCFLGEAAGRREAQEKKHGCGQTAAAWPPLGEAVAAQASHAVLTLLLRRDELPWQLFVVRRDASGSAYPAIPRRNACSLCGAAVRERLQSQRRS